MSLNGIKRENKMKKSSFKKVLFLSVCSGLFSKTNFISTCESLKILLTEWEGADETDYSMTLSASHKATPH